MTDLWMKALAGQTPARIIAKAALSLLVVGLAAMISREGPALAVIIIFTGVTGPAIRLVAMKMDGVYDRIIVSPVSKPRIFCEFAGLWAVAVLVPLVPAIVIVVIRSGPVAIIPIISGTVLAVTLGTLAGFVSRGLSEAHLAAILTSVPFIILSFIRTPAAPFIPYTLITSLFFGPVSFFALVILPLTTLVVLTFVASRI
jgi:hypothetical protein